jgi:glycosyltransferase involved in cell wall biosynthesis
MASTLQRRIEANGLTKNIRLLGFLPEDALPVAYRAADLSVVPTQSLEGFGLVAVESLAAGTPVIVTPVGGLPDIVSGVAPNLVLPDTAIQSIARHIIAALTGQLTLPSASDCQSYAAERYAWPHVAAQIRTVYDEVQ